MRKIFAIRKPILAVSLVLVVCSLADSACGQIPTFSRADAGVSDEFLIKLGTAAESYLIQRLTDPRSERFHLGLVLRLETVGSIEKPSPKIFFALCEFVDRNIKREADIGKTLEAVGRAFRTIGMRGGVAGADYLANWIQLPEKINAVRCHRGGGDVRQAREYILKHAILGLGFSGGAKADHILRKKLATANSEERKYLRTTIVEALKVNAEVQSNPIEGKYRRNHFEK
jgi:hypothetical protein